MNIYVWLIRREFWENRAIWIIPAALGAALILAACTGTVESPILDAGAPDRTLAGLAYLAFGTPFFVTLALYSYWYLLESLHADRKDRSVLFWKSLPISDTATVLSKVLVALLVIPLVYLAADDLTSLAAAGIVSLRLNSAAAGALWRADLWLQLQAVWLYLILTTAVWYLPVTGWLLVVSAWARRAVLLWSILPPLALMLAERLFLGTHVALDVIERRLIGYAAAAFKEPRGAGFESSLAADHASAWQMLDPAGFLANPGTWMGAAAGAALIATAIQLRMRRAET